MPAFAPTCTVLQKRLLEPTWFEVRQLVVFPCRPTALVVWINHHIRTWQMSPAALKTDTATDCIFAARGVTKTYRVGDIDIHALRGIDLDLYRGEFVVILGPSGSGKSTLLNILGGLDIPTSGSVHYLDHDLSQASPDELTKFRREHVGFVFQFYNLIPSLTTAENVALITEISRNPLTTDEALSLVGLSARADHFPAQLSGGEQQRVAIARAIAKRPDVLLCDEPTGALDLSTGVTVLESLQQINKEGGTLTVVITHNASIAEMADRVLQMRDGSLVASHHNTSKKSPAELKW